MKERMISATFSPNIEIQSFFEQHRNDSMLPICSDYDWSVLNSKYDKKEIAKNLAHYVVANRVPFPYMDHDYDEMKRAFFELVKLNNADFLSFPDPETVVEKYSETRYPYTKYGIGLIDVGPKFNRVSNFFQEKNRYACGGWSYDSPQKKWETGTKLAEMLMSLWRMGNKSLNYTAYKTSFLLNSYVATQFKPPVAKILYDLFQAKIVLDTSCGWGDRLAGFYASSTGFSYTGCDPNPDTNVAYQKQIEVYSKFLDYSGYGKKTSRILCAPSEDLTTQNFYIPETYDFYFTSPPYFATERYAEGSKLEHNQSWKRYDTYEKWERQFYFPTLDKIFGSIQPGGYGLINIMDPKIGSKRYRTTENMIDYLTEDGKIHFLGIIGMRIKKRPKGGITTDDLISLANQNYIEPIYCFGKQVNKLPDSVTSAFKKPSITNNIEGMFE